MGFVQYFGSLRCVLPLQQHWYPTFCLNIIKFGAVCWETVEGISEQTACGIPEYHKEMSLEIIWKYLKKKNKRNAKINHEEVHEKVLKEMNKSITSEIARRNSRKKTKKKS